MPKIFDQHTDRSGAELVKIASRLENQKLGELAIDTLFNMDREITKIASFPTDTPEETFLSRIYFEGQREKLAADEAEKIASRLSVFETLHDIKNCVRFKKIAAVIEPESYELLPDCSVCSAEELTQAGKDFESGYTKLAAEDRRVFATRFIKIANALGVDINDEIKLHAGVDIEPRPDMKEYVYMRKLAMERGGHLGRGYSVLCETLSTTSHSIPELAKLASYIDAMDEQFGVTKRYTLPDGLHTVFRVKTAEENTEHDVSSLSKSDIVARYGEGILEEVEDDDGNIDKERLKEIVGKILGQKDE